MQAVATINDLRSCTGSPKAWERACSMGLSPVMHDTTPGNGRFPHDWNQIAPPVMAIATSPNTSARVTHWAGVFIVFVVIAARLYPTLIE